MSDDLEVEAAFVVELGKALVTAGDLSIGAAVRLKSARTAAERAEIRARLRGFIRRTIAAAGIALVLLEESGVGE